MSKMHIDERQYRAMRQKQGATAAQIDGELAEMMRAGAEPDVPLSAFTPQEIEIAKNIVGNDPAALQKHLNSLAAYKRGRAAGTGYGR